MASTRAAPGFRGAGVSGKQSFLPPKSPLPGVPHQGDGGFKNLPRTREGNGQHQRTSSASFLIEEQPSWLDDLLNEPETPVKRGTHRRSSSDSSAYLDLSAAVYLENSGGPRQLHNPSHGVEWQYHSSNLPAKERVSGQSLRSRGGYFEGDAMNSLKNSSNGGEESAFQDCEKNDGSELDPKRAKQKFAQRSRVRKLQYIAELERTVQAMQGELSDVAAEVGFLDQQNIILSFENEALKRRLDGLTQEKILKCVQQETLEREISRLRAIYQQQHRHQSHSPAPGVRELDSLFGNLSLKQRSPVLDGNN